jgi:DNA-binding CsgD family transcriptional regulator
MTDRGGVRRVTVVATTEQGQRNTSAPKEIAPAAPLTLDGGCEQFTRLETALDIVTNLIRLGEYRANLEEGVLFDAVVGDVRCLFIELEPARMVSLSPREQQIARMVAWGRTNQAIASSLEISVWTVSTHLRRIFAKLAVSSRAEMVAHLLADPDVARAIERGH